MLEERRALVVCECHDLDHLIELSYWPPDSKGFPGELYFTFHLKTWKGFFRRLWQGLRYAFSAKPREGAWSEVCISQEAAARMIEVLSAHVAVKP